MDKSSGISKGQAQLIMLFLVLVLVPTTVIVAQNATNSTASLEGMVTSVNNSDEMVDIQEITNATDDAGITANETLQDDETTVTENEASHDSMTENVTEFNVSSHENSTIVVPANDTTNLTIPENVTDVNVTIPDDNQTEIEENVTIPDESNTTVEENETVPANETDEIEYNPSLSIRMSVPEMVTRGSEDTVRMSATVFNSGFDANGVVLEWILPDGFSVVEGNDLEYIGTIPNNVAFTSRITVSAGIATERGINEISVRVRYD